MYKMLILRPYAQLTKVGDLQNSLLEKASLQHKHAVSQAPDELCQVK